MPFPFSDKAGFYIFQESCKSELSSQESATTVARQVSEILLSCEGGYPNIQAIAARIGMTERTLRRQLSNDDVSFRELLGQARFEHAKKLLLNAGLTVEEAGFELGYSNASNFRAAFKLWAGMTPQDWKARHTIPSGQ